MEIVEYHIGDDQIQIYYKHEGARREHTAFINIPEFEEWITEEGILGEQEDEVNHNDGSWETVRWVNDWSNYTQGFREDQIKEHLIDFRMSLKK